MTRRSHRAEGPPRTGSRAAQVLSRLAGPRPLAALAGACLACLVGVLLISQAMSPAACASVRAADALAASSGTATWYTLGGTPNCSYPSASGAFVALGPAQYQAAGACGSYLDLTGPDGSVRVKVVDQCPECGSGELDLSKAAFAKLADPQRGKVPISYRRVVNPPLPGGLSVRVKEGSSQWWLALLIDNHGNPLTKVEVGSGSGSWSRMTRTDYNYWLDEDGAGTGPFRVRVTDDQGHVATLSGIDLEPGATQKTSVLMYGGPASGAARTTKARPTTTKATPKPSRTTSRTTTTAARVTATTSTGGPATTVSAPPTATPPATDGSTDAGGADGAPSC